MSKGCATLFVYSMSHVTADDIVTFAPADPGYVDYVSAFMEILSTHRLPVEVNFEIRETIGLTRWVNADDLRDAERFRRFRVFTNSVALSLGAKGIADDGLLPPNYTVASLLADAFRLDDRTLLQLMLPSFDEFHSELVNRQSEEAPFLLLASLLIRTQFDASGEELNGLVDRLMREESEYRKWKSNAFLLGNTVFNQLHGTWKTLVDERLPSTTPQLELIRDAILNG